MTRLGSHRNEHAFPTVSFRDHLWNRVYFECIDDVWEEVWDQIRPPTIGMRIKESQARIREDLTS